MTEEQRIYRLFKQAEERCGQVLPGWSVDFYGLQELDGCVYGRCTLRGAVLRWVWNPQGEIWGNDRIIIPNQDFEIYSGSDLPENLSAMIREKEFQTAAARARFTTDVSSTVRGVNETTTRIE